MRPPPDQIAALSEDVALYLEIQKKYPLAVAALWSPYCHRWDGLGAQSPRAPGCGNPMTHIGPGLYRCDTAGCANEGIPERRTSQREAIQRATAPQTIAYLLGGANRAGKTDAALQLAIATAGGRSQWWAVSWCRRNGLSPEILPENGGTVWISALTYSDALEYHRPTLDKYLPAGCRRRQWESNQQATVFLPGGGQIVSKASALGRKNARRRYQGKPCHLIILDEEHELPIFEECMARTGDFGGRVILSMTPLMGLTWPYEAFLESPSDGYETSTIYGLDNPYVSSVNLRRRFAGLEPSKRDARLYGRWSTAKGRIYPGLQRSTHLIPNRPIPADWIRYRSIDFGSRFACVWGAVDPSYDRLHIYRVLYTEDKTIGENASEIIRRSGTERYRETLGDPADRVGILTLNREHGIPCRPARKGFVEVGISHVSERLQEARTDNQPRIVFHRSALEALKSLERYRRNDDGTIRKEADHLADAVRYLCTYLKISSMEGAT